MALVTKVADASIDVISAQTAPQRAGLTAGAAIDVLAPCVIDPADGLVYMCNGTAADARAQFDGFAPRAYAAGDTNVTLIGIGLKMRYGSGLTPGSRLYIGATAGRLDTAATTGDAVGIAKVVSANDIRVIRDA